MSRVVAAHRAVPVARPKDMADDCFWIVDHTVQIGQEKCLVILGLRLRDMPAAGTALSLADLQLLNLLPVTHSDKQVVHDQLESTTKITGVPRAILAITAAICMAA